MKLIEFLIDRIAYTIVYFVGVSLVMIIMYLTAAIKMKEIPLENILYAYLVSVVIYLIFMVYEYLKVRNFNKQLTETLKSENILNINQTKTMEQKLFKKVLTNLHKSYEKNIIKYEETQKHNINFINQWVHQMKTPVSVINLILQEDDVTELKESIREENEKISQGLNIMLYNARMNEFNHDFVVESVDLAVVLRKIINDNKKLFIRYSIFPKIEGKTALIETDKKWIYFVINQIVINAIKYTNAAERDKKIINFRIEDKVEEVILSIEDNGIGIPKEDLGRVCNAFFTGKNGRKTSESTGMGMYLSKRICDELGHRLLVESEEEKRTVFYIIFVKGKNIFKI